MVAKPSHASKGTRYDHKTHISVSSFSSARLTTSRTSGLPSCVYCASQWHLNVSIDVRVYKVLGASKDTTSTTVVNAVKKLPLFGTLQHLSSPSPGFDLCCRLQLPADKINHLIKDFNSALLHSLQVVKAVQRRCYAISRRKARNVAWRFPILIKSF